MYVFLSVSLSSVWCAAERERVRDLAASLCRGDFTSVLRSTRNESLLAAVAAAVEAAAEDDSISMWGAGFFVLGDN